MIIWLTHMNMMRLLTVMYAPMDNIVYKQYDSSGCVNCAAGKYVSGSSASDHVSESNCKICGRSRYSYDRSWILQLV